MPKRVVLSLLPLLLACAVEQGGVPAGAEPTTGLGAGGAVSSSTSTSDGGTDGTPRMPGGAGGSGGQGGAAILCEVDGVEGTCLDVSECGADYAPVPGHCPGPANVQCCIPLPEDGTCVPGAMVSQPVLLKEAPGIGGCPDGMVRIEAFCIDRFEASLVRIADDSPWSPYFHPGAELVRAVSVQGAVPQGYIDQVTAEAACLAAGKRLCADGEWLRACGGASATVYPYGDALESGTCNDHRAVHPAVEYFGTTDAWIYSAIDHECLNQLPGSLDACGTNAGCVTEDGVFDMVGNLHEWTADPAGTFRGGFYVDTVKNGPGCLYATTAHDVHHWDYSTGFRCCADP